MKSFKDSILKRVFHKALDISRQLLLKTTGLNVGVSSNTFSK